MYNDWESIQNPFLEPEGKLELDFEGGLFKESLELQLDHGKGLFLDN